MSKEPFLSIAEEMKSQQGAVDVKSGGTVTISPGSVDLTDASVGCSVGGYRNTMRFISTVR